MYTASDLSQLHQVSKQGSQKASPIAQILLKLLMWSPIGQSMLYGQPESV